MKKYRMISVLSGITAAAVMFGCASAAPAASGTADYNTVNVALNGEQRLAAGENAIVAGASVPSSIRYTGEGGSQTNYLPIRTISELLGVQIEYDAATGTVNLIQQPQVRQWQRVDTGSGITYRGPENLGTVFGLPPARVLGWLPEQLRLDRAIPYFDTNGGLSWCYEGGGAHLTFDCYHAMSGGFSYTDGPAQTVKVLGRDADFYAQEQQNYLIWEDDEGVLCVLYGTFDQETLVRVAENMQKVRWEPLGGYGFGWVPESESAPLWRAATPQIICETWSSFEFDYAAVPMALPSGTPETVRVKGAEAQYWEAAEETGGVAIGQEEEAPSVVKSGYTLNVLVWTDAESGYTFRLTGILDKDTLLRMADSVALK